ncbi:MAG: chromate efflux transporter [Aestuariivirga sp.]
MLAPSFTELCRVFSRIGFLSFGGPAGQIALMHREVIDERKWVDEKEYLTALNFCMLLPGPEATQLATWVGWRLHGTKGGIAAGLLFVLPGAAVVLALAMIYQAFGSVPLVEAALLGIKAAVLAIVIEALLRVARRALKTQFDWMTAAMAFIALFVFNLPFPVVILVAAYTGLNRGGSQATTQTVKLPRLRDVLPTAALWLAVWLLPLALLVLVLGPDNIFSAIGIFFAKLSIVTFGGAYAALSYIAQASVERFHWLTGPEMIDSLGLAETTPGPLILVSEFVGYLAAARATHSVWGGVAGAIITLWMTFAPCFLWVLTGAPYIVALNANPRLSSALQAIMAAVVGVIMNLSVWFGLNVLFGHVERHSGWFRPWLPEFSTLNLTALALVIIAALVLLKLKWSVPRTLLLCGALGFGLRLLAQ